MLQRVGHDWAPEQQQASKLKLVVKSPPANAGGIRDVGSIPGSGRSPGGMHGNPLQCSSLKKSVDRGAWGATVYGVAKTDTPEATEHIHTQT